MAQKVCFLPEALVAFTAVKGFLSCVCPLVCEEMGTLIEGFATLGAAIGSVSQVDPLVGDEVGARKERARACPTRDED